MLAVLGGDQYQSSCREEGYVKVTEPAGVISSLMVSQIASNGMHGCPWLIIVEPGQRVNITLMDYGTEENGGQHRPTCLKYGLIRERGVDSHTTGTVMDYQYCNNHVIMSNAQQPYRC